MLAQNFFTSSDQAVRTFPRLSAAVAGVDVAGWLEGAALCARAASGTAISTRAAANELEFIAQVSTIVGGVVGVTHSSSATRERDAKM